MTTLRAQRSPRAKKKQALPALVAAAERSEGALAVAMGGAARAIARRA